MIYGDRIRLRKNEKDDLPRYVQWFNDPEVRRGLSLLLPMSADEERSWYDDMLKRPQEGRPLAIDVRSEGGWRHIGSAGLFDFNWINRRAEFGIVIGDKSYWNLGYGTEATILVLKHGFENLNLNKISLRVFRTNPRARRAYEKAGYVQDGVLRQDEFLEGQYVDAIVMSVLRQEWSKRDQASGPIDNE